MRQLAAPSRSCARNARHSEREGGRSLSGACNHIETLQSAMHTTKRSLHPDTDGLTMTNKRKHEFEDDSTVKRQRRRKRSRSAPLLQKPEKRQALKRLHGRICSVDLNREDDNLQEEPEDLSQVSDENEDPLLDSVPVDMDPEQLGFLVCAQETLRFLHGRGIPPQHPIFARLRSRLLQGIDDMAVA